MPLRDEVGSAEGFKLDREALSPLTARRGT